MRWPALLAVCSCDRALNLGATAPADGADAAFFDAAITTGCPPPGITPHYSQMLVQDFNQLCGSYTVGAAAGRAMALCYDETNKQFTAEGPLDQLLVPTAGIDDQSCTTFGVRVGGDGAAYVACLSSLDGSWEYRTFAKQGDIWVRGGDIVASPTFLQISAATTTRPQHLVYTDPIDSSLHELVRMMDGSFVEKGAMPLAMIGATQPTWVAMTSDGLRLTLIAATSNNGVQTVLFTDRAQIDDPFRTVSILDVPVADSIAMTDDCSRVYLTGLQRVWYVDELKQ